MVDSEDSARLKLNVISNWQFRVLNAIFDGFVECQIFVPIPVNNPTNYVCFGWIKLTDTVFGVCCQVHQIGFIIMIQVGICVRDNRPILERLLAQLLVDLPAPHT
jgi:hypothetical protein